MDKPYRFLIAKNDKKDRKWIPLWIHCLDTFHVMEYLFSEWMSEEAFQTVVKPCSLTEIRKISLFLAIFHDYGKASLTFQSKITENVSELKNMLEKVGLSIPSMNDIELRNSRKMPHGIAGEILLLIRGCDSSLSAIVGAHHGVPWAEGIDEACEIQELLEEDEVDFYRNYPYGLRLWGGKSKCDTWRGVQDDFYKWACQQVGIDGCNELPVVSDSIAVILTGLLIMADWISSNEEYFPLLPYEQISIENIESRAKEAIKKIKLPPAWCPEQNTDYHVLSEKRFGFEPNEIQAEIAKAVINGEDPGLLILEAPMGIGKTEAALLAAEEFSTKRVSGMIFALPTQATANGVFSRILEWGKSQTDKNSLSIRLAHAMASLNEEYTSIMGDGKHAECDVDDYEGNHLIIHDFFQGRKQALLADFVVGTVDQVLLAALKQKHFMLRHLGLSSKVVIIDECHAYDAYMNEYLERALQWLGSYHTPVIMLSATLPYERRAAFIDAYRGYQQITTNDQWRKTIGYPLLTWTDRNEVYQKEISYSGSVRNVLIEKIGESCSESEQMQLLAKKMQIELSEGGCAAIIVNTVRRAQSMADMIKKQLPDKKVILLHSRFISEDRYEKEAELLKYLGKQSRKKDRDGVIVIGTQVIEQSLDFDVDLMASELCPMDLLLQRIGRLHRHSVHDLMRSERTQTAKCYVIDSGEIDNGGSAKVYGDYLLMRTRGFLPKSVSIPTDIAKLVQLVYDETNKLVKEPTEYEKAAALEKRKRIKERKDANAFRLQAPGKEKTINRYLQAASLADEEEAKAQVRNGTFSLEVVALFSKGKIITRAPWRYHDEFETSVLPNYSQCRAISNQRLRLPAWVTPFINKDELRMPLEWEKSVWLNNQYILIFDEKGRTQIGEIGFRYDQYAGLTAERRTV